MNKFVFSIKIKYVNYFIRVNWIKYGILSMNKCILFAYNIFVVKSYLYFVSQSNTTPFKEHQTQSNRNHKIQNIFHLYFISSELDSILIIFKNSTRGEFVNLVMKCTKNLFLFEMLLKTIAGSRHVSLPKFTVVHISIFYKILKWKFKENLSFALPPEF